MTTLVAPSEKYKESYLVALREYHAEGRSLHEELTALVNDFASYVQTLHDLEDPAQVPTNHVPSYRYWLIDEGQYVGELNIRPALNDYMLKWNGHIGYTIRPSRRSKGYGKRILELGLLIAPSFGLKKVLITCDADNVASRKIIEHNNGVLEDEAVGEKDGVYTRRFRYWIELEQ